MKYIGSTISSFSRNKKIRPQLRWESNLPEPDGRVSYPSRSRRDCTQNLRKCELFHTVNLKLNSMIHNVFAQGPPDPTNVFVVAEMKSSIRGRQMAKTSSRIRKSGRAPTKAEEILLRPGRDDTPATHPVFDRQSTFRGTRKRRNENNPSVIENATRHQVQSTLSMKNSPAGFDHPHPSIARVEDS